MPLEHYIEPKSAAKLMHKAAAGLWFPAYILENCCFAVKVIRGVTHWVEVTVLNEVQR